MLTIFAQASAPGKAGVSVFRISGDRSYEIFKQLCPGQEIEPKKAYVKKIFCPKTSNLIDHGIVIYFKSPHSFTGEDIIELHLHGSVAISKMLTEAVLSLEGIRMAEPGEFAKRSFLNGKIDLTQAEGLADLIEAETIMQHKQATRQMSGELENTYEAWRRQLLKILGLVEAYIDFPDEDIPSSVVDNIYLEVSQIIKMLQLYLNDNRRGERLRNGLYLSIFGSPNVGKSTIMNYLSKREVSIVSNIAGTTRDVVESHLDIGGYPVIIADTAGIHVTDDFVEQEGIKKARHAILNADIKIAVFDDKNMYFLQEETNVINSLIDQETIIIINKSELLASDFDKDIFERKINKKIILSSAKNSKGLEQIIDEIISRAENIARPNETLALTRVRHRVNLENALKSLEQFNINNDMVLAAEDLRMSARYLSILTGKIDCEEILGEIFSNFCIGK